MPREPKDFFKHRKKFGSSPGNKQPALQRSEDPPTSSPLSDLLITTELTVDENGQDREEPSASAPQDELQLSAPDHGKDKDETTPNQSFMSIESALTASSQNGHSTVSRRRARDGTEVVDDSDGDTDSSLEPPEVLLGTMSKPANNAPNNSLRDYQPDQALLAQLAAPKKYRNTIDSLVHDAVDDDEIEANVAKVKANYVQLHAKGHNGIGGSKKALNENMLATALRGESDESPNIQRLMDAVRRTEALERHRVWRFFNQDQTTPVMPAFPTNLFTPESPLAALRDSDSRARILQSGVVEYAASLQHLPDEFFLWLFKAIPLEPREEMRQAYCRILTHAPKERMVLLARQDAIDGLFRQLGARPRALITSDEVVADPSQTSTSKPTKTQRSALISILSLIRGLAASEQVDEKTRVHTVLILLRVSIDTSLTSDPVVRSELQATLTSLLEFGPKEKIEYQICRPVYECVREPQFQSRLLQHIIPTSTWVSLLRYRMAVAFLLQDSGPLKEPPESVLDLQRITALLTRDERFQVGRRKNDPDYDYGDLVALTSHLEVCVNTALADLKFADADTESKFNAAIDQMAARIKKLFTSIEDTGASHLQRMLAKQALETLHYRMMYSVRSKAPPKRTLFQTFQRESNRNVKDMFQRLNNGPASTDGASEAPGTEGLNGVPIPIRGHDAPL
ncbi:hypothetical protein POX_f07486 [Penicillium oxalicum]|uniref:hypothetical protein n=1 Tax=Penicillium oxalicum TaxID=69781 RepID=UPI0020B7C199|nr:hypothetical protein POX_f07486 [Penicillium oxalicum]KAI2787126.1 hypothetical protein POX_f07486 [Penicillium oxalicum]